MKKQNVELKFLIMKTLKATFIIVTMLVGTAGFSQVFGDFDSNQDDLIDRDEFSGIYSSNFPSWDSNMDGTLDDREFYDTTFNRLDADMDGNLGELEWNEGFDNVYGDYLGTRDMDQFDENGDRMISGEEYYNGFSESDFYSSYDSNRDSSIDADEFNESVFNNWDENGDGTLDNSEFDKYRSRYIEQ